MAALEEFDEPPQGAQALPEEFDAPPQGAQALPEEFDAPPEGATALPEGSTAGAVARGAVEGAAPALGGLAAGLAVGVPLSAAATPFVGIPAGLAAGVGAGMGIDKFQDWLLEKLGLRKGTGFFSEAQKASDEQDHSLARSVGGMLPAAATLRPGGTMVQRGVGAAIGGVGAAAQDYMENGDVKLSHVLTGAGLGAAMPNLNRAGQAIERAVAPGMSNARLGIKRLSGMRSPEPPATEATPPPDASAAQVDEIKSATAERDRYPQDDPLYKFWDDHVQSLTSQDPNKGNAGTVADASQGPRGEENKFTPQDADRANDLTTTAKGVAAENPKPPQNPGAGNPVGSPMLAREGARPGDPERDYRKVKPFGTKGTNAPVGAPEQTAIPPFGRKGTAPQQETPSTVVSQAPIHEDLQAALAKPDEEHQGYDPLESEMQSSYDQLHPDKKAALAEPEPRQPPGKAQWQAPPEQAAAPPQVQAAAPPQVQPAAPQAQAPMSSGLIAAIVRSATQRAMRRPIMETPMPTGANSSKDPNGMIYVNPNIPQEYRRFLAIHETVEQDLMARGMPYKQAHQIAEQAERQAVEAAGYKWDSYNQHMAGLLDHAENQGPVTVPDDLHVSVEEALGHYRRGDRPASQAPAQAPQPAQPATRRILPDLREQPTAEEAPVTAPVTPQEIELTKQYLDQRGLTKVADHLESLSPEDQADFVHRLKTNPEVQEQLDKFDKAQYDQANRKTVDTGEEGRAVQTGGGKRDARKQAAVAAMKEGAKGLKQIADPTDQRVAIAHAKELYARALAAHGGKDPIDAYPMREKSPEYNIVRAARNIVRKANGEGFKKITWKALVDEYNEAVALGGKIGKKVDLDIALKRRPSVEDAEAGAAGSFDAVAAEDAPVVGKKSIRTAADLNPTKPGTEASPGRVIPRGSAEFKAIAARFAKDNQGSVPPKKEAVPSAEGWFEGMPYRMPSGSEAKEMLNRPILGTDKGFWDHVKAMLGDESGAMQVPKSLQWMFDKAHDLWDPQAPKPVEEYADAVGGWLTKLRNRQTGFKGELKANVSTAPVLRQAENDALTNALERRSVSTLPRSLQDFNKTYIKPLADKYGPMYDEAKDIMTTHKILGWDKLPDRVTGIGSTDFFPRLKKGQPWETDDGFDPLAARGATLGAFADTLQQRNWMGLENPATGQRLTYYTESPDSITIMRNGAPQKMSTPPGFEPTRVGDTLHGWNVSHATVDEIKQAAGKDPQGNWREDYHKNPLLTMTNAVYGLNNALQRLRVYRDIVEDPLFGNVTTKNKNDPRIATEGWITPQIPQFKDTYMPKQLAWVLNDFHRPGLLSDVGASENVLRYKKLFDNVAQAGTKLFYFFGPGVHMLNEADKWAIGRGFNWLTPQGVRSLVVDGGTAIKDVWTQGPIQKEIREAGGNLMFLHTATSDFMPEVAKKLGVFAAQNPSKWDPIARIWGVKSSDLARQMYKTSTKGMWWVTDVLATQRYLEEKRLRGLSNEAAVKSMHDFIDSYVMPTTVGGKGDLGRATKNFLADPSVSLFAPYHMGVFHSWANMTKGLVQRAKTPEERLRAASQMAVAGAMLYAVYPLLSKGYQALVGDPTSKLEPRGMSRLAQTAIDVGDQDKGVRDLLRNAWTPSVLADTASRVMDNKDFTGQDIMKQGSSLPRKGGELAQFIANQFASPLKTVQNSYESGDPASLTTRKFLESQVGLKTPSLGELKRQQQLPRINQREDRAAERRPRGFIEDLVNAAFR